MDLLCLVSLGTLVLSLVLTRLFMRPRKPAHCPDCGSREIGETGREATGMRYADISGSAGGGHASTQLDVTVTYRCNACRHTWTRAHTETR